MNQNPENSRIYAKFKDLILSTDREHLLPALKDKFRSAAVEERGAYKLELLKLAQEPEMEPFHGPIFETLASLNAIWSEYIPRKGLIQEFNRLYEAKQYKEAAGICSYLISQGLDYLDAVDIGPGEILPLYDEKDPIILQFDEQSISFLDLNLNVIHSIESPLDRRIIDVLTPIKYPHHHANRDNIFYNRTWVLLEDRNNSTRSVISLAKDRKTFDPSCNIEIPGKYNDFNRLSRFLGHLMLVGNKEILYYRADQDWEEWLTMEDNITCFQERWDYYWIGIADGHVRIIKKFELDGVRESFDLFPSSIICIGSHEKCAAAASKNEWLIATPDGEPTIKPINSESAIRQIAILNDDVIALLQNNGRLLVRNFRQDGILWQINLEDRYDSLLNVGDRVYCKKNEGPVILFILPDIQAMMQDLKMFNISITEGELGKDPTAPIRDRIDFYGRESILSTIRQSPNTLFFITGAPRSGKTSLLNILSDFLSANSRCCYIDMEQLDKESSSYNDFAEKLYSRCLSQHGIAADEIMEYSGYQWLKEFIKKVRGGKDYCVFCLDNFAPPEFTETSDNKKFDQLIREMFVLQNVRLILAYDKSKRKEHEKYFREINPPARGKLVQSVELRPFNEEEAKTAIRKMGAFNEQQVADVFHYTGGFPFMIRLFQKWDPQETDIEDFSERIASDHKDIIFTYFKDLSRSACLILATLLYKDLISKRIAVKKIYSDYPLLSEFVKPEKIRDTLKEISDYGGELKVNFSEDGFMLEIEGNPRLFYLAARYIPWIKELFALYQFSIHPSIENAKEIILAFRQLLGIEIEDAENPDDLIFIKLKDQFKHQFYVRRMSQEARDRLRIPLATFLVIPLKPWEKRKTGQYFNFLYSSLQEYLRRSKKARDVEVSAVKFYIMLFSFMGTSSKELKEEMIGLERVSIIDSQEMSEVLLADNPLEKTREILFQQLKISERSPYISAGPVEELFYGRDIEIALVRNLPENIGIFGTRTIGKTSLMLKLYRDLKGMENWQVIVLDCGRIDSEEKLLAALAEEMKITPRDINNIEKFKKFISHEAEDKKVKYLFLLDEVDQLIAYDVRHGERIFRTFNSLCTQPLKSKEAAARFILSGFEEMFNQMKNFRSRLYNFMVFLPIKALDPKSALALVTRPMANIFVRWQNREDAKYLVDQCSGHPWLLQAACHTLLKILKLKSDKLGEIERQNVETALFHDDFTQLCLRPYESIKSLDKKDFFPGIYKIAALEALLLHLEKGKELFSLNDIKDELNSHGVNISPDQMHTIITGLCLHGIFKYVGDPDIIMKVEKEREEKIKKVIQGSKDGMKEDISEKLNEIKLKESEIFDLEKGHFLEFKYQFAVKIFPRILSATLGGLKNCRAEIENTIKRKK